MVKSIFNCVRRFQEKHKKPKRRILFLLKRRHEYNHSPHYGHHRHGGLWLSVHFAATMLNKHGIEAKVVEVIDNNSIDREVRAYKPTDVIIEALWVVPKKFDVLKLIYPNIRWFLRVHSELPFLAQEGNAISWIIGSAERDNVYVACNSLEFALNLQIILPEEKVIHLPNLYDIVKTHGNHKKNEYFDVGCFGAIRPLKNQLLQAFAAIKFAKGIDRNLRFHINATRIEGGGESVLKNLQALFPVSSPHQLVEHPWLKHNHFLELLREIDLGMQVSLSETFNIVTADMVSSGLPIVVSPEVFWTSRLSQANPTNVDDIVEKMKIAFESRNLKQRNLRHLQDYISDSVKTWLAFFSA